MLKYMLRASQYTSDEPGAMQPKVPQTVPVTCVSYKPASLPNQVRNEWLQFLVKKNIRGADIAVNDAGVAALMQVSKTTRFPWSYSVSCWPVHNDIYLLLPCKEGTPTKRFRSADHHVTSRQPQEKHHKVEECCKIFPREKLSLSLSTIDLLQASYWNWTAEIL